MTSFVELVGPSGVGKSTFYRNLIKTSSKGEYVSFEKASSLMALPRSFTRLPEACFTTNLAGKIRRRRTERTFKELFWSRANLNCIDLIPYSMLMNNALKTNYASDRPFELKLQIDSFMKNLLTSHFEINMFYKQNSPVIMDEGILMNVRGLNTIDFSKITNIEFLLPKVVINCFARRDTVIERYIRRSRLLGLSMSSAKANEVFDVTNSYSQSILNKLGTYGVKILSLNCEHLTSEDVRDTRKLINNLLSHDS